MTYEALDPEPNYSVVAIWQARFDAMTPEEKAAEEAKAAACKAAHAERIR